MAGCVVLCVDNEPTVLEGMQTPLSGWGCKALAASSVAAAVRTVEKLGSAPDVILADYHLDGETGLDVVMAVRAAAKTDMPAIFITADHSLAVQKAAPHSVLDEKSDGDRQDANIVAMCVGSSDHCSGCESCCF